jgi:hypothetical protein
MIVIVIRRMTVKGKELPASTVNRTLLSVE